MRLHAKTDGYEAATSRFSEGGRRHLRSVSGTRGWVLMLDKPEAAAATLPAATPPPDWRRRRRHSSSDGWR
eukprot:4268295-Prymnesium_polylepis.1